MSGPAYIFIIVISIILNTRRRVLQLCAQPYPNLLAERARAPLVMVLPYPKGAVQSLVTFWIQYHLEHIVLHLQLLVMTLFYFHQAHALLPLDELLAESAEVLELESIADFSFAFLDIGELQHQWSWDAVLRSDWRFYLHKVVLAVNLGFVVVVEDARVLKHRFRELALRDGRTRLWIVFLRWNQSHSFGFRR